jgi:hypothetical protein
VLQEQPRDEDDRSAAEDERDEPLVLRDERVEVDGTTLRSQGSDAVESTVRRDRGGPVVSFAAVAKRVRSSSRPGRRNAPRRPVSGPGRASPAPSYAPPPGAADDAPEPATGIDDLPRAASGHLTDAELRRAEALQAAIAAEERAAAAEQARRRTRAAGAAYGDDVNAPLKVRAAHEYAYVARDVRRIVVTGGIMLAILATLAILINVMGVVSI